LLKRLKRKGKGRGLQKGGGSVNGGTPVFLNKKGCILKHRRIFVIENNRQLCYTGVGGWDPWR
jgi:hypothetical protein